MFLQVDSLSKVYGSDDNKSIVLNKISFFLEKGSLCTLLGPSGSGKSTLLNAIGGLESCQEGSILIDNTDITKLKANPLGEYRRNHLGFVFQFYNLIPDLTVAENIQVGSFIGKDCLDLDTLIKNLDLWEHRNKFPKQLSGGQQQRCAIGRALIKKPDLLLCDEPTGALDYKTSKDILALIQKINKEYKTTVIMATHNEAITHMADRTIRLRDGMILADTKNDKLVSAKDLEW